MPASTLHTVNDRIRALQALLTAEKLDAYIIPTRDFHQSEYVGDFFQLRRWLSGFTGSAGTLVVTQKEACLWADGRYHIQAEKQLKGSDIILMKMGLEKVPKMEQYITDAVPENGRVGFDGRTMSETGVRDLEKAFSKKNISVVFEKDVAGTLWVDRPGLSAQPAFLLEDKYTGKSVTDKLADLRGIMNKKNADLHILTSLDDIAWLFNLRGGDVECNPVVLSYAVISKDDAILFLNLSAVKDEDAKKLAEFGVTLRDYHQIIDVLSEMSNDKTVLLDPARVNSLLCRSLKAKKFVEEQNPTTIAKAVKNSVEIENLIEGHIRDGVAVVNFLYWLKHNVGKQTITEISAAEYLAGCRKAQPGFLDNSFSAIVAYKGNAAMAHYSATPESFDEIKPEGMLLVDSGGQYIDGGTTDITRTIVLGDVPMEQKKGFTAVLRGMIRLSKARFLEGCKGYTLDMLARGPLWDMSLDFQHGTGHGVGYLLNVHEGPNGFAWNSTSNCVIKEGMVTTNEPGLYEDGVFGIRCENELLCRRTDKNKYGQFLYFQTITVAPFDRDAIVAEDMDQSELDWLNTYHADVYEKLAPRLAKEIAEWLKSVTAPICK